MEYEIILALAAFAFVTVITPGPNNLMLMASGANFGLRRSLPHMLGVGLGFPLMILPVGIGLMQVFDMYPILHDILKWLGVAYMVWLAWKIANAAQPDAGKSSGKPLNFWQAAAFQWVNPKAWAMALTAISTYAPNNSMLGVFIVAATYVCCGVISTSSWTLLGREINRFLTNANSLRLFNYTMAAILLASLYPVLKG